jgi:hypothetical protein
MKARQAKKSGGFPWGPLGAIATIVAAAYGIWHTQHKDDEERAAAAARVHQARLTFATPVGGYETTLSVAYRQVSIEPLPPLMERRRVQVYVDGVNCQPSADLEAQHNDIRLTLARCAIQAGATGMLTWSDDGDL